MAWQVCQERCGHSNRWCLSCSNPLRCMAYRPGLKVNLYDSLHSSFFSPVSASQPGDDPCCVVPKVSIKVSNWQFHHNRRKKLKTRQEKIEVSRVWFDLIVLFYIDSSNKTRSLFNIKVHESKKALIKDIRPVNRVHLTVLVSFENIYNLWSRNYVAESWNFVKFSHLKDLD